jgi:hypothetical protein
MGPQRCEAAIWRAGVQTRCAGRATAAGNGVEAIEKALASLVAQGHRLPATATVCAEDEFLYFTMLPANTSWNEAHDAAIDYFEAMVGSEDLLVETSLAPCGTRWVAVAIEGGRVDGWRAALTAQDIEMQHVRAALLEDLWSVRDEVPGGNALVAMLRDEGATVVALRKGCIAEISWERCDLAQLPSLSARLNGCRARFAQTLGLDSPMLMPLLIVPQDSVQHRRMAPLSVENSWQLAGALLGDQVSAP